MTVNVGNANGDGEKPGKVDNPFARDPRVRRALDMAVDRETLVRAVLNDWAAPACSPIPPATRFATRRARRARRTTPQVAAAAARRRG